jgi:hypothetical protein
LSFVGRLAPQDFTVPNLGEKKANVKSFASSGSRSVSDYAAYQELHGLQRAAVKTSASRPWRIPMSDAVQRVGENVADLVKWNFELDTKYSWKS